MLEALELEMFEHSSQVTSSSNNLAVLRQFVLLNKLSSATTVTATATATTASAAATCAAAATLAAGGTVQNTKQQQCRSRPIT